MDDIDATSVPTRAPIGSREGQSTARDGIQAPRTSSGDDPRVVDRYAEEIGVKADAGAQLGPGSLLVELRDALRDVLGREEGTLAIPISWIAGVRRDEIRLSLAISDPAFRSRAQHGTADGGEAPTSGTQGPGDETVDGMDPWMGAFSGFLRGHEVLDREPIVGDGWNGERVPSREARGSGDVRTSVHPP